MANKVIIVGGGISGLSAAQRLCTEGGFDVTILEAEDRIGGRLNTVDIHGHKIELGAEWIHGTKGNVLYELLSKELPSSELKPMGERYYADEDGEVVFVSGRKLTKQAEELFEKAPTLLDDIEDEIEDHIEAGKATQADLKDVDLMTIARRIWNEKYLSYEEFKSLDVSVTEPIFQHVLTTMNTTDGAPARAIGCLMYYHYYEFTGPDVAIPNGCSVILDILKKSIPTSAIKLGCKVQQIHWNEEFAKETLTNGQPATVEGLKNGVQPACNSNHEATKVQNGRNVMVECAEKSGDTCISKDTQTNGQHTADEGLQNGVQTPSNSNHEATKVQNGRHVMVEYIDNSGDTCALYADHVIVTVSLGCLKKYQETLFRPKLPPKKQVAIQKMGFGAMNEIFLYYEKKFWDGDDAEMHILWDSYKGDVFSDPNHWCREINCIETFKDHFLIVWINESASKKIRSLSPCEVSKTVVELVRKLKNDVTIPLPDDVTITNWDQNKNFLGTYSNTGIGETLEMKREASEPLFCGGVPRVLFSGEAMHETRYGTMDGAYLTGIREAERIINYNS